MKKKLCVIIFFITGVTVLSGTTGKVDAVEPWPVGFREVWGYLIFGDEKKLSGDEPVTDICCVSVGVTYRGRLTSFVTPPSLRSGSVRRRCHLVVAILENSTLTHFCLDPVYGLRDVLVNDIEEQSVYFDGIQIDFEAVPDGDASLFVEFLRRVKEGMGKDKMLSVALPARTRKVKDSYSYETISSIADRVIVMAYDQHWRYSDPGPVASLKWCRDVARYSKKSVPEGKLVMGIPLYGRSWQRDGRSRAVKPVDIDDLVSRDDATFEYSTDTGWIVRCDEDTGVVVYFDDISAIREKLLLYRKYADSVAFWRLGMEKNELWDTISLDRGDDFTGNGAE